MALDNHQLLAMSITFVVLLAVVYCVGIYVALRRAKRHNDDSGVCIAILWPLALCCAC